MTAAAALRQRAGRSSCAARRCARSSPTRSPTLDARGARRRAGAGSGDDARAGDALVSTDPGAPDRVVAARRGGHARRRRRRAGCRARPPAGRGRRRPSAPRCSCGPPACCASAGCELAALEVRECAKPWPEADARRLRGDRLPRVLRARRDRARGAARRCCRCPGERNTLRYARARRRRRDLAVELPARDPVRDGRRGPRDRQRGACSSRPSSRRAARAVLVRALREAGVPPEALALLPGEGDVGAALVRDPRVHTIAFTGSVAVGLEIVRTRRRDRARPAAPQARDRRDGRQELRDRRRATPTSTRSSPRS